MNRTALNDQELHALFDRLFPNGLCGGDVRDEIAPGGWVSSPLLAGCRTGNERAGDARNDRPVEPDREAGELVGACLWDIFSNNHDVLAPDGRQADIGSFRGAAGFLAEYLNAKLGEQRYDYMDFYMGTIWRPRDADPSPVYRMIFRRLKREECDWHYSFPRLGVVDLRPPDDDAHAGAADWAAYSPSAAVEREQDRKEKDAALAELRETFAEWCRQDVAAARQRRPPATVQAYRAVFGHDPQGWPP